MTEVRHVIPKVPLTAIPLRPLERLNGTIATWQVRIEPPQSVYSDAEFAAAFVDAAVLTELVDAARDLREVSSPPLVYRMVSVAHLARLQAALAAFDAAMLPEGSA